MGKSNVTSDRPAEAFDVLVRFGALMWRAGSTAIRTREWMELLARKMGYDALAVSFSLENISASAHRSGEWKTMVRAIGPPAVNAARIAELEQLARTAGAETSISQTEARLSKIEAAPPLWSRAQISAAIAMASGSFAFLNGAGAVEVCAAAIGEAIVPSPAESIRRRGIVGDHGFERLRADRGSGTDARLWIRTLLDRLHRVRALSGTWISPDCRSVRFAAAANGPRRESPGIWPDDSAGRRGRVGRCNRNCPGRPVASAPACDGVSAAVVAASRRQLHRMFGVFPVVQYPAADRHRRRLFGDGDK